ncbi:putative baseplate assembly protein [Phenylobacterium immobile]|uniref:putative baseplate assembly protein n=1 Tax=Phenylobacterium immobile TaxID=21 RepID=UPI000B224510|nr:putative baseplate assembly protein [Phenylobacterium immobile]
MPLLPPIVDGRRYEDIVAETLARAQVHTPEWNNLSDADPGVTLVQLFAFMTESMLYRADQIPERNRLKFLDLLGVGLAPGQSARGLITVKNEGRGAPATVNLAAGFEVQAGDVPFRAERGLDVLPVETVTVFKRRLTDQPADMVSYYKLLYASWAGDAGGATLTPELYETVTLDGEKVAEVDVGAETVDGALWVAILARPGDKPVPPDDWTAVLPQVRKAIAHKTLSLGVAPVRRLTSRTLEPVGVATAAGQPLIRYELPAPPASGKLPDDPEQRRAAYRPIEARALDDILTRAGVVELALPSAEQLTLWSDLDPLEAGADNFPPVLPDEAQQARVVTWIRISPSVAADARFSWVGGNATTVTQRVRVNAERLEAGDGTPDQTRTLAKRPVVPGSVAIEVASRGAVSTWSAIDDLFGAPPETGAGVGWVGATTADVFRIDAESGLITFGDGFHGRRPPQGASLRATYDFSMGAAGNVPKAAIKAGTSLPAGLKAENPIATWGGADAETLKDGERQITRTLQHRDRLVTAADFEAITLRTPGVEIGRVEVLPAWHPDLSPNEPGDAPGVVTLMLIPAKDTRRPDAPEPDQLFLDAVCRYLDDRRLVTTELVLRGPRYRDLWISVGIDVVAGANPGEVREAVAKRLREHLSPLGDPTLPETTAVASTLEFARRKGWPLRRAVTDKELLAEVARVPGVLAVNDVLIAPTGQAATAQIALRGLDLPRIAGLSVAVGEAGSLDDLRGAGPAAAPPSVRRVPAPVIPERC